MYRKHKKEYNGGGGSWLETYADTITLLLTFFILLYSMSNIDEQKYQLIIESIVGNMNPAVVEEIINNTEVDNIEEDDHLENEVLDDDKDRLALPLDELYDTFKNYIEENNLQDSVKINKTDNFVYIRFTDEVAFDGYSYVIKPKAKEILRVLSGGISLVEEHIEDIIIHGHTAKVSANPEDPIGRKLSSDRANEVLMFLEGMKVVSPERYISVGYGPYRPIADNSTSEGRAVNRRVEIYITVKGYTVDSYKLMDQDIRDVISEDLNRIINQDGTVEPPVELKKP